MNPDQHKEKPEDIKVKHLHPSGSTSDQGSFELILNWYKINGKNLIGEESLSSLNIRKLLNVLGNPIWNQLYHCWTVELKHMPELQPFVHHQFNPEKFVYFIEAYKTD